MPKGQMETQQVLLDDTDSMANSIICTNSPGNIFSTLTPTNEQHPFERVQQATENCGSLQQHFEQMAEKCQRLRSIEALCQQNIDHLLEKIRRDCANMEKSREMLQQCIGIPEPEALCLRQMNTKQRKEASAQAKKAEQKDRMEASEHERHHAEMLQQWEKEKAEREQEHKKVLFEMRQKVATLQTQQEAEQTRFENAKQEVLLEEQNERSALSEALLQTQGELSRACQQVQQLRQEVKEQQEKGQTIKAELQAELQEAHSEFQAAQRRHKEELQGIKEEMNLLLEQREALQKQIRALQDTVLEMESAQATQKKELLQELEELRAGEQCLKASVHLLETEVSQLRVRFQRSEHKALALARQCNSSELELRKAKAEMDKLRAHNQELQMKLAENWWKEQLKHTSREIALQKEATERQEEAETLRQEVASLQRKLESLEKERKDVLHEREMYQQKMRDLEKKNEMHAAEMRNHKENSQQLEVEREGMQEELEHGAAALKKWIEYAQVLRAALSKSEMAKGALKKDLDILKEKTCIQPAFKAQVEKLYCMSDTSLECEQPGASPENENTEWPELSTDPRGIYKVVASEGRRIRTFRRVFYPDYFTLSLRESAQQDTSTYKREESSSSSGEPQLSC
ncbi:trichohyalin-like [Oenanthe melanoleuca]|uniref:trichohyalin-like n=1 Tax=Oenanthe melanoleuca TaxID=2939378 RepID=UPI0024C202AE|nr:trichohyalin-like [Oenanthe melanoleuca]